MEAVQMQLHGSTHSYKISRALYGYGAFRMNETGQIEDNEDESRVIRKQLEPLSTDWSVFFWYKRACIRISRSMNREIQSNAAIIEVFKVTAYGTRNKQLLLDMLEEARKLSEKKPASHISYFRAEVIGYRPMWQLTRRVQLRMLSSIILREGITETIEKYIDEFIQSRHKERGIPYRRGYLLHGTPGCSKTSYVKAISGQIGYDIYELQLSNRHLTDQHLNDLISQIGQKSILLFEDVDAVFTARSQDEERAEFKDVRKLSIREAKLTTGISFAGILNAIDGVASEEDYIIFMTSNHINKLDSALIRPGRIDLKQLIDYPDENQIAAYFKKFYPDCDDALSSKFLKAVNALKCNPSISQIQGVFLKIPC